METMGLSWIRFGGRGYVKVYGESKGFKLAKFGGVDLPRFRVLVQLGGSMEFVEPLLIALKK